MDSTPPSDGSGWIDPRRPLTASKCSTGGLACGGKVRRRRGHRFPTVMTDENGGVAEGRLYTSIAAVVNPDRFPSHPRYGNLRGRHSPTAMTDGSGGVGGGSSTSSSPPATPKCKAAHEFGTRFVHRHPPVGNTNTDPYWIRGGLQRLTTVCYIGNRVAGGMDGANPESEAEIDSISDLSPMSTYPFKVSTESWDEAVAEADLWMKKEGFLP